AAAARARETSLLAELEEIERRLAEKQTEVARLAARIRRTQSDIAALRGEIARLEGQRTTEEEALARLLRVMYRVHAQGGALPLILSGDDPVTRATAVRHLASLAALDARLIREYRGTWNGSPIARVEKRRASRSWPLCTPTRSASRRRSTARPRSGGRCSRRWATSAPTTSAWWASSPKLPADSKPSSRSCRTSNGSWPRRRRPRPGSSPPASGLAACAGGSRGRPQDGSSCRSALRCTRGS